MIILIVDYHTLQIDVYYQEEFLCVIDDSLKQKDDKYLTNSCFSLSPITVGFILFNELLQGTKWKHW